MGSDNTAADFVNPSGSTPGVNPASEFPGRRAEFGREDGFVLFGTQIVDQRSIVATEGVDYLTNWDAWLDCQNGADFNNIDVFRSLRRFITTPRDLATYVHFDALYQAYLVACLIMLADSNAFPKDRGLAREREPDPRRLCLLGRSAHPYAGHRGVDPRPQGGVAAEIGCTTDGRGRRLSRR